MNIQGISALVTGGASGLGFATATRLAAAGAHVVIVDLPAANGDAAAAKIGGGARFVAADITDTDALNAAFDDAAQDGALRAVVHCAARGGPMRILDKEDNPNSLELFAEVVRVNVVGTFNVIRLGAARMAKAAPINGERGAFVLTASVAAFEGQIGQMPYAASKASVHGMTIVAARDLATRGIRVCTIAPGIFDTPMLGRLPENVKASLGASVPFPARLGEADEYAALAIHIIENAMLNGETIRLDGALRMAPR